jgi:hypothetical protein
MVANSLLRLFTHVGVHLVQGSFAFASCTALSSLLKPALRLYAHPHHNMSRSCSSAYDMHCKSVRSS